MEQIHDCYDWKPRLFIFKDLSVVHKDITLSKKISIHSGSINVPMLMDTFVVIVLVRGYVCGKIDECFSFMQRENGIIFFFPGQKITINLVSEDFDAFCIITSDSFFEKLDIGGFYSYFNCASCRDASPAKINEYRFFFNILYWMMAAEDNSNRLGLVSNVFEMFFQQEESEAYCYKNIDIASDKSLLYRYTNLIKSHYKAWHDVCSYANALHLSPKYFSATIRRISGKSASEWINEYLVFQAIDLIRTTDLSMKEIAFQLGFPSSASFGNFFKRITGKSPGVYRGHKTDC